MHNKFMVLDHELVFTGSFNWSNHGVLMNRENIVVLDDVFFIENFTQEFSMMWEMF